MPRSRNETGFVTNFFKARGYGFVTREGKESSLSTDIQLHVENAKGDKLKEYIRKNGLRSGAKVSFTVDYEEHKGKPFASNWTLCDGPDFSRSRSRSGQRVRGSPSPLRGRGRQRASPSYGRNKKARSRSRSRSRSQKRGGEKGGNRGRSPRSGERKRERSFSRRRPRSRSRS